MYIHIILQSWPEYVLEKFLGTPDSSSLKVKSKYGDSHKRRGAHSKNRLAKDSKFGGSCAPQTFEEYFRHCLEDASPDCRHYARQSLLTFYEIWPDETEAVVQEHKAVLMKHKEMVSKLGPLLGGTGSSAAMGHVGRQKDRKTYKAPAKRDYLSPSSGIGRREQTITKSQNRIQSQNKFLSEERDKPSIPKPTDHAASVSTGFRNYRK